MVISPSSTDELRRSVQIVEKTRTSVGIAAEMEEVAVEVLVGLRPVPVDSGRTVDRSDAS